MGDNDDYSDQLAESSRQTTADIESKKKSLFQTRLDIIKGGGQQSWTPQPLQSPEATAPDISGRGRTARDARNAQARKSQGL